MSLTLAHMSDVHLGPMPDVRRRELLNKRLIGFLNWHRGRKNMHQRQVVTRLLADLKTQTPDHVAVTGDLVNIGLPAEFEMAHEWLSELGPPADISVVPGNHDAYVRLRNHPGIGLWGAYMRSDDGLVDGGTMGTQGLAPVQFPYARVRGDVALIGVSSAITTAPFIAAGRLGGTQRLKLARLLRDHGAAGHFRVLMIHHPPNHQVGNWRRGLRDAAKLLEVLQEAGVELILHGHNHRHEVTTLQTASGATPVVGVPSASVAAHKHLPLARYNLFRIKKRGNGFSCVMTGRGISGASDPVKEMITLDLNDMK